MATIPEGITKADVLRAVADLDNGIGHAFGDSTGYDLVFRGRRYPPKAALGLAAARILGHPLGPYDFKGGEQSQCFRVLRQLGFTIEPKRTTAGENWSADEARLLVKDYFAMLAHQEAGVPYNKTEHRQRLMKQLPGRSKGSIEYKHQNVSGVLAEWRVPWVAGYKPAKNFQRTLN